MWSAPQLVQVQARAQVPTLARAPARALAMAQVRVQVQVQRWHRLPVRLLVWAKLKGVRGHSRP